jgi:hypothetical protein
MDPDPGGPKTRGSGGSGFRSATLVTTVKFWIKSRIHGGKEENRSIFYFSGHKILGLHPVPAKSPDAGPAKSPHPDSAKSPDSEYRKYGSTTQKTDVIF